MPARIVLVDDHELLRDGLRMRLQAEAGFEVVGQASTASAAYTCIAATRPDLVIMDLNMPDESGIAATAKIRAKWPTIKVLILTGSCGDRSVSEALDAGADGYIRKEDAGEELVRAVRAVLAGKSYLSPDAASAITQILRENRDRAAQPHGPNLTEREIAVLKGVARGLTYKEIAGELGIGVKSVETYRARLARKIGVTSKVELARYALSRGLIEP